MMKAILAPVLALCLFTGCAPKNTTTPTPTPVQNLAQANKLMADAATGLIKTVITLRDQGKISAAATSQIENWVLNVVIPTGKQIDVIEASSDTWAVQKSKLIGVAANLTVPAAVQQAANADPGAAAALSAAAAIFQQIIQAVNQ